MDRDAELRAIVDAVRYKRRDSVLADAREVLASSGHFVPKALYLGDTRLLALHGMVQIFYSGSAYWTPLCIFLPQSYPEFPPIVYVMGAAGMYIVPSHMHVDGSGKVTHKYLSDWNQHSSGVWDLIKALATTFSMAPPMRAAPASGFPQGVRPAPLLTAWDAPQIGHSTTTTTGAVAAAAAAAVVPTAAFAAAPGSSSTTAAPSAGATVPVPAGTGAPLRTTSGGLYPSLSSMSAVVSPAVMAAAAAFPVVSSAAPAAAATATRAPSSSSAGGAPVPGSLYGSAVAAAAAAAPSAAAAAGGSSGGSGVQQAPRRPMGGSPALGDLWLPAAGGGGGGGGYPSVPGAAAPAAAAPAAAAASHLLRGGGGGALAAAASPSTIGGSPATVAAAPDATAAQRMPLRAAASSYAAATASGVSGTGVLGASGAAAPLRSVHSESSAAAHPAAAAAPAAGTAGGATPPSNGGKWNSATGSAAAAAPAPAAGATRRAVTAARGDDLETLAGSVNLVFMARTIADAKEALAACDGAMTPKLLFLGRYLHLALHGMSPLVMHGRDVFMTPLCIFITELYPEEAPMVYVMGGSTGLYIEAGHPFVRPDGRVQHAYLTGWRKDVSTLKGLITALANACAERPPMKAFAGTPPPGAKAAPALTAWDEPQTGASAAQVWSAPSPPTAAAPASAATAATGFGGSGSAAAAAAAGGATPRTPVSAAATAASSRLSLEEATKERLNNGIITAAAAAAETAAASSRNDGGVRAATGASATTAPPALVIGTTGGGGGGGGAAAAAGGGAAATPLVSPPASVAPTPPRVGERTDLFLSYAWGAAPAFEGQARARQVLEALKAAGYKVWFDADGYMAAGAAASGTGFQEAMAKGILYASAVVMCVSPDYAGSKACKAEAEFAAKKGKPCFFVNLGPPGYDPGRYPDEDVDKCAWLDICVGTALWADCRTPTAMAGPGGVPTLLSGLASDVRVTRTGGGGGTGAAGGTPGGTGAGARP